MRKSGFVAIAGRPNAGKSTLLNALLGTELSIVTPKAQTTRERVLGILTEDKGQIVFVDTPGIHRAKDGGINEYMVNEARESFKGANVVWYIVDPRSGVEHEALVLDLLKEAESPVRILLNKVDMKEQSTVPSTLERFEKELRAEAESRGIELSGVDRVSALKKSGLDTLMEKTWADLPEGPLYYPDEEQMSDRPVKFFVAEKVREQLFHQLGEELPYSCAVEIEKFDEQVKPPRIEAVIHVERDSQKGMVIGKGGAKIKSIGQHARKQIEKFMGQHVFLGLKVKVLKDWTKDAEALKRMGYNLPAPPKGRS